MLCDGAVGGEVMIEGRVDQVVLTDAWRRPEYTGTFIRYWLPVARGTWICFGMERVEQEKKS